MCNCRQNIQFVVRLGDVDILAGLGKQSATAHDMHASGHSAVDVEIVALRADTAAVGVEINVHAHDVRHVASPTIEVRLCGAVAIENRARTRHQRDVSCMADDAFDTQVNRRLFDVYAVIGIRVEHSELCHRADAVEQVDFQEVRGFADATHGDQRDIDAGHVSSRVVVRIKDGRGRVQRDVVGSRGDISCPQIADQLGHFNRAVRQHHDVTDVVCRRDCRQRVGIRPSRVHIGECGKGDVRDRTGVPSNNIVARDEVAEEVVTVNRRSAASECSQFGHTTSRIRSEVLTVVARLIDSGDLDPAGSSEQVDRDARQGHRRQFLDAVLNQQIGIVARLD